MNIFSQENLLKWGGRPYWTNVLALARTVLATGTLITLLFNAPGTLFKESLVAEVVPMCNAVSQYGIWCIFNTDLEIARWLSVLVLLWVISGWFPRYSAIPHWWIAFSYSTSATMVDGGDQITTLLTLFIIPVCLMDTRKNHWHVPTPGRESTLGQMGGLLVTLTYWTVRIQVALIYFEAAIGKMFVEDWVNGTALYYWFTHPTFGADGWLRDMIITAFSNGTVVAFATWGVILFEVLMFMALFLDVKKRKYFLIAGVFFHMGIIMVHGLVSFFCAMTAALILYLQPWHMPVQAQLPAWSRQLWHSVSGGLSGLFTRSSAQEEQTILQAKESSMD